MCQILFPLNMFDILCIVFFQFQRKKIKHKISKVSKVKKKDSFWQEIYILLSQP